MDRRSCGLFYFTDKIKSLLITDRDTYDSIIHCLPEHKYISSYASDKYHLFNNEFSGILETSETDRVLFLVNSTAHSLRIKRFLKKNGLEYISACLIVPSFQNPRWILPLHKQTIGKSTRIIKPSKLKSIIAYKLLLFFNLIGYPQLIFPFQLIIARKAGTNISVTGQLKAFLIRKLGVKDLNVILYTGSPGVYQKFTVQVIDKNGQTLAYAKIGMTDLAKKTIKDEVKALKYLENKTFTVLKHPNIIIEEQLDNTSDLIILQTPSPSRYKHFVKRLSDNHLDVLEELFSKTTKIVPGNVLLDSLENDFLKIKKIITVHKDNYVPLFEALLKKLRIILDKQELTLGFSQGDFAPWNMYAGDSGLFVFDWEISKHRVPMWDLFNFILHTEVLIFSKKHKEILSILREKNSRYAPFISRYVRSFERAMYFNSNVFLVITLYEIMTYYIEYHMLQREQSFPLKSTVDDLLEAAYKIMTEVLGEL